MLKELFGGKTPEQVLLYLENYEEGFGKRSSQIRLPKPISSPC